MKKLFTLLLLILFFNAFSQEGQECETLLRDGLYAKMNITTKHTFNQDLKTYFLSEQFKSDMKKGSWGVSLSLPVDGVPLGIGSNSSDEEFEQFTSRIKSSSLLNISVNDFVQITKDMPNPSLYEAYNECKRIEHNPARTGIIEGKKIENEETVIFQFYYRPKSESEKAPKVKSFVIEPKSALIDAGGIKVGKRIPSFYNSVICRRSEVNEITLRLQTDQGPVTGNSGPTRSSKFELPIGSIISSYLSFDRFKDAIDDQAPWKSTNKWAPCDGREVSGSAFAKFSGSSRVPDLRGVFLRGLNVFDLNPPSTVSIIDVNQKDPDERTVGSMQIDSFKSHSHGYQASAGNSVSGNGSYSAHAWDPASYTTSETGGIETRPKNKSVYYYVKIN